MNSQLIAIMIDFIIIIYFLLMLAKGIKEGFIVRFYDIATALLVFMLSFYLTPAFSNLITLHNNDNNPVYDFIGPYINQILIFFIILIILLVVRKLLGLLLKPALTHLSERLRLTALINRFLGALVGILEAYLISGLILTMIVIPFVKDGKTYISQAVIATKIVNSFPANTSNLSNDIKDESLFSQGEHASSKEVLEGMLNMLTDSYQYYLISKTHAASIIEKQLGKDILQFHPSLTSSRKQVLAEILQATSYDDAHKTLLLENIGDKQ